MKIEKKTTGVVYQLTLSEDEATMLLDLTGCLSQTDIAGALEISVSSPRVGEVSSFVTELYQELNSVLDEPEDD